MCTYGYRPVFQFRELGCLPRPCDVVSERHSAAMSGRGWAEDKKRGEGLGGGLREEVSM